MTDDLKQTIRLKRPSRAAVDDSGHTVWEGPVVETELELISTLRLKKIIDQDDDQRRRLEAVADGKDGVLARHADSDTFEIVDDDDLMAALASAKNDDAPVEPTYDSLAERADTDDEAFSLVSTMALRRLLGNDGDAELAPMDKDQEIIRDAGFDPYNNS